MFEYGLLIDGGLDDAGLEPNAFRVYCRIVRLAAAAGFAEEPLVVMAKAAKISVKALYEALDTLVARNMVDIKIDEASKHMPRIIPLPVSVWSKSKRIVTTFQRSLN